MGKRKRRGHVGGGRVVPFERYVPDDLEFYYSDDVVIQHAENMFYLTFGQIQRPIVVTEEDLTRLKSVRIKAIARFAITPAQIKSILNAMKENYDKYVAKFGEIETEEVHVESIDSDDLTSDIIQEDVSEITSTEGE